ncbi:carbohydrate kinase family protein [Candidatus Woesearchaeota archaeon]|nr:carbohydrate kinase family protein [Candidatus Woesearchaeota archaeon]
MFDIITMGSNTVDIFVHTDQSDVIDIRSRSGNREFISYPVGTKMLITKHMESFGGNGTNAAVTCARLGLKTAYLGEIGRDDNGNKILANLKKEKVSFIGPRGAESGFSIILDSIEEDRTILVYKGCNNDLSYKEIKTALLKTKWFYLSSMLGESLNAMKAVANYASQHNIKIAFNPSATLLEKETKTAIDLLRYSDVLVLNKEEAESLVGMNTPEVNIKKLLVYGPQIIAITDGKNGAIAYHDGYYYKVRPRPEVKVVETTGAGDAFAATLVAGLIMKKPFELCLKMAINNAESNISHAGAQEILLTRKKILEIVKKDHRSVEKRKDGLAD